MAGSDKNTCKHLSPMWDMTPGAAFVWPTTVCMWNSNYLLSILYTHVHNIITETVFIKYYYYHFLNKFRLHLHISNHILVTIVQFY